MSGCVLDCVAFAFITNCSVSAEPASSSLATGPDVPIPRFPPVLSHHRLFEPDTAVEPVKKVNCPAIPDPAIVAVPEPVVSTAQYQTEVLEFHFKTSPFAHPPRSLRPSDTTSRPELLDLTVVVPAVVASIVISSAFIVIPFPPPILMVRAPVVPPPDRPEPAVTAVVAYVPTLPESSSVPLLPVKRLSSVVERVAPSSIFSSVALDVT